MAEVINITESPLNRLRHELEQRDTIIRELRMKVEETENRVAMIKSVNDLLRLQLTDLITTLRNISNNFNGVATNLATMHAQLPDIK